MDFSMTPLIVQSDWDSTRPAMLDQPLPASTTPPALSIIVQHVSGTKKAHVQ